jgi:hypothetical protein
MISKARIKEYMFGRLASWHFRNQLYEMSAAYRRWSDLLSESWPGVQVKSFNGGQGESGKELSLVLREGPFASEAAWVGSGLQAWMQILWFLCRADNSACIVLDEPDVFLHADMQRKVAKIAFNGTYNQAAIATHSSEIISDVEPSCITVIRKRDRSSWKPGRRAFIQPVIDGLGSRHNLQLSKLASARRIALFEGEDQKFLLDAALKKSSDAYHRLAAVPSFDLGGVDNWQQAVGAAKALFASSDGSIPVILVMDRDYKTASEVDRHIEECKRYHLNVHYWTRKEIENYLICPNVVYKIVQRKVSAIAKAELESLIDEASLGLKDYTIGAIADQWQLQNRRESASRALREAQSIFSSLIVDRPLRDVVSGKRLIADVSALCKERYSVSFAPMTLCREFTWEEFPQEFRDVIDMLLV